MPGTANVENYLNIQEVSAVPQGQQVDTLALDKRRLVPQADSPWAKSRPLEGVGSRRLGPGKDGSRGRSKAKQRINETPAAEVAGR